MIESITSSVLPSVKKSTPGSAASEFSDTFKKAFNDVNKQQLEAHKKMSELVTGQNKDIHGTMIALEKADVSLRLSMAVRNKVVSAYEEIMRMQV